MLCSCCQNLWGLCQLVGGIWVVVISTQKMFSQSAEMPFKISASLILYTCPLEYSTPVPWAVSALSALLREGMQVAPWGEKLVPYCLRAVSIHSHSGVQGEPGHLQQPPSRAHQMSGLIKCHLSGVWLCRWPAGYG